MLKIIALRILLVLLVLLFTSKGEDRIRHYEDDMLRIPLEKDYNRNFIRYHGIEPDRLQ